MTWSRRARRLLLVPLAPVLAAVVTLVVALAATTAPALAASWSGPDPAGDAVATTYSAEPEPCGSFVDRPASEGDIRRLSVRHTSSSVRLTLRVTGLRSLRRTHTTFAVATPGAVFDVRVDRGFDGPRPEVSISKQPRRLTMPPPTGEPSSDPEDAPVEEDCGYFAYGVGVRSCPRGEAEVDIRAGLVRAVVPRRCLGTPRWVRVGGSVSTGSPRGGASWTHDEWAPGAGDDGAGKVGAFGTPVGPRVRPSWAAGAR